MTDETAEGPLRISIAEGRCIGAGNCVEVAEDYFDQDDDDARVIVLQEMVPAGDQARIRRAVNVCPVQAILLGSAASQ